MRGGPLAIELAIALAGAKQHPVEVQRREREVAADAVFFLFGDVETEQDLAIAIRTAVMAQGVAYVQAGAGIVADSVPANEEAETRSKARAVLQAIATAETLRP